MPLVRSTFGCSARAVLVFYSLVVMLTGGCAEPPTRQFIRTNQSTIAITHARVIDGTGSHVKEEQTVVIHDGRIASVGKTDTVRVPADALVFDGSGRTLIPGLVGMHEHLFYQSNGYGYPAQAAFARLYLASGVTTVRTAGTIDFDEDLRIKQEIDSGGLPGPKIHVTGPYLNTGSGPPDPDRVTREVTAQANRGATSFKAYVSLRRSELQAAIQAAHARGLRITGHLCAVGYREAAAMGIDNLEHGLALDPEFYSGKQPDLCPDQGAFMSELAERDVTADVQIQRMIADLVHHGVAVTSTLAIIETFTGDASAFDSRMPILLAPRARKQYEAERTRWTDRNAPWPRLWSSILTREMQFERAFVRAGGRLMAGVDPTGWGGLVAGLGDQREVELLVEAGLTPETAIRVATLNGADFLYEGDQIGSIEAGKHADVVLVRGNPSANISDVRNVEVVFKDGVAYDPAALIAASQGTVGEYQLRTIFRFPYNVFLVIILSVLVARRLIRAIRRKGSMEPALASR
jgi:imidazolonepropionase-like amidohydrolase